ncbi:NB-ARC domain-containing protein [Nocardiopsis suaedae]|uniref:NB-ARC domain-containing protein n=1 Tax=Nocardiopsis suaedae TaxID=3018444 RepID=A0ABT4TP48_9ACTN|nr:NB-ARC domain-containing protein [Nocardiopsis suaedae]MDA2806455.1 NB-ARC domain-containing protein [Nocardiopsis suaedae]
MTERTPQRRRPAEALSRRRLGAYAAAWTAWGGLSITATVLQNAPDLLDWLPNEAIWGLVVIGALAQLPFIVRDVRRRAVGRVPTPFWREGRGKNLLHPEPHFTGYGAQQRQMLRLFRGFPRPGQRGLADRLRSWRRRGRQRPPLVVVVTGAPGTGKSQLANRVARYVTERFPDDPRWVDLTTGTSPDEEDGNGADDPSGPGGPGWTLIRVLPRRLRRLPGLGAGPDGDDDPDAERKAALAAEFAAAASARPRPVADLLEELLGASGDSPRGPRRHLEEAWRSRTAGRRLLLVLENAEDPRQVEPLLPNSPDSAVIVTARAPFHDAGFDFESVYLEGLTDDEGAELLDLQVDLPADPAEREEERLLRRSIAAHCHGLPLALKMCGTRLASHSGEDTRELLEKLRSSSVTPLLGPTGFPTSFLGVFRLCGTQAARLLHRMAATGMQEAADYSAAALLDLDRRRADAVLKELAGLSLIEPIGSAEDGVQRYRQHQLVHDTMRKLGPAELGVDPDEALAAWSDGQVAAAGRRLVAAYTWMVERAAADLHRVDAGFPQPPIAGPAPGPGDDGGLGLAGPESPPAWLDREREVLLGCLWLAADAGHVGLGWRLARSVAVMCQVLRAHWSEWDQAVEAQLAFAYGHGDLHALGMALLDASELSGARGQYRPGIIYAERALYAFEQQGVDERWLARAHRARGVCLQRWGELDRAKDELERAEAVMSRHGERWWRARALYNLAELNADIGHTGPASDLLRWACDIFAEEGDTGQSDLARVLLAEVHAVEGRQLRAWYELTDMSERFRAEGRLWYAAQCLRALGGLEESVLRAQWRMVESRLRELNRIAKRASFDAEALRKVRGPGATAALGGAVQDARGRRDRLGAELADLVGDAEAAHAVRERPEPQVLRRTGRRLRRAWSARRRREMVQESIVLMERMGDEWGVHRARVTLGRVLVAAERFREADAAFRSAAEGFASLSQAGQRSGEPGDKRWEARTHHIAAEDVYRKASPPGQAVERTVPSRYSEPLKTAQGHALEAMRLYRERGNSSGEVAARILLARIMWVDGAFKRAVAHHLKEARDQASEQLERTADQASEELGRAAVQAAEHGWEDLYAEAAGLHSTIAEHYPEVARRWPIH